jgi:glycerophosphoryl diester phosphodiesterase
VELIAHRGASWDAPENTLAAVNLGWQQGADAVEVDLQFSKDGQIVVIHDYDTKRTGGLKKPVTAQTLAELRTLDVGKWKDRQWTGQRIPTLGEVLATIPDGKRLFIEIKCGAECIAEFERIYRACGKQPAQVVPIGFSLPTLQQLKARLPQLTIYWVAEFKRNWTTGRWTPRAEDLIEQARIAGMDGLDLGARGPINGPLVKQIKAAGLGVYVWTVDSVLEARQLAAAGVDGLATNRPGWLREKLKPVPI